MRRTTAYHLSLMLYFSILYILYYIFQNLTNKSQEIFVRAFPQLKYNQNKKFQISSEMLKHKI